MESVVRAAVVYAFLLVVFRLAGKRTLSEATTFDLVLLLIISETTQHAMVGDDHSLVNAGVLILTLVGLDIALSIAKHHLPGLDPILDGTAVIVVRNGKLVQPVADRERVDVQDILEAARCQALIERLDQIKLAVIERSGNISILPFVARKSGPPDGS